MTVGRRVHGEPTMPMLTGLPQPQQYPSRRKLSVGPQTTSTVNTRKQYTSPMSHRHLTLTVVGRFYPQSEDDLSQGIYVTSLFLFPFPLHLSGTPELSLPPLLSHPITSYVRNLQAHYV